MIILNDFNTSVEKALSEIDPNWKEYEGLIVCGTHAPHDVEMMIEKIKEYREAGKPFLGICFGHQLAAIEYARNVLGQKEATSEEFGEKGDFIVYKLSKLNVGLHAPNGLYRGEGYESYWNNYEVRPNFLSMWKKEDNFITVQYHPEYQSSKDKPHPVLVKFLDYAREYTRKMAV